MSPQELPSLEISAFARLIRAATVLRRELEADVLAPRGLTLSDFDALYHLARAEDNALKRVELAQLLSLTPSGVTRLLEGLEDAGLVEKRTCSTDARVSYAALTVEGARTLECVGAEHAERLRAMFSRSLADDDVSRLSELLDRLPGVGDGSCAV